jgi:hypothetical protein
MAHLVNDFPEFFVRVKTEMEDFLAFPETSGKEK